MLALLSDLGCINIQGVDSVKFLQGQLTCHVELLAPNSSCLGAHCNPQGRVISLFYLLRSQDTYQLIMRRDMVSTALAALKKYAVFFKVQISDASDEYIILGGNRDIAEPVAKHSSSRLITVDTARVMLIGEKSKFSQTTYSTLQDEWHMANINNLIPTIYPNTSSLFLPHEINLDLLNAIHFEKGCYTGQEIIARMHYRGKIKNRLYKASVNSSIAPSPGSDIYAADGDNTRTAGTIVDAAKNSYNKYDLLIIANEATAGGSLFLTADKNIVLTIDNQKANI